MTVTLNAGTVEERLAAVWSEVLDGVPVTRSDNFFELGGDSLLIIETVALAREEGLDFTPLDLIEHQTVAELAARITRAPLARSAEAAPEDFPLTAAQHRLCTAQPHPRHVTQSALWHADGLDAALLAAALTAVVDHHDSFRLRLVDGPGEARLRYAARTGVMLEHLDLSGRPTAARERSCWRTPPACSARSIPATARWCGPRSSNSATPGAGSSSPPTTWRWTAPPGGSCAPT